MGIVEKRKQLIELSAQVAPLVGELGEYDTVNEALLQVVYKSDTHQVFKTFNQWKKEGKRIKKGEKAFLVWAMPKRFDRKEKKENERSDTYKYFPICFLFSNAQVEEVENEQ